MAGAGRVMEVAHHPRTGVGLPEVVEGLRALGGGAERRNAAERDFRKANLVGADLAKLNLSRVDFSGADLSCADLSGSNLSGARLHGATLFESRLDGCELLGADLSEADLSRCSAEGAGFGGVNLRRARLSESKLRNATFTQARLEEADLRRADLRGARICNAELRGADLSRSDLRATDLSGSHVDGASFDESDLGEARVGRLVDFERARWIGVDIRETDFRAAMRLRRMILDQNYLEEFRNASRASSLVYHVWWLTSDCGRSFGRWALWTVGMLLLFAGLYGVVDVDYGPHPTALSPLYYSVVTLTTLGYGDVLPASTAAQVVAMIEVLIGYLALGGLMSIFANKMARRAD